MAVDGMGGVSRRRRLNIHVPGLVSPTGDNVVVVDAYDNEAAAVTLGVLLIAEAQRTVALQRAQQEVARLEQDLAQTRRALAELRGQPAPENPTHG